MIDTGDLKKGLAIELDGALYTIVEWTHIKMGRGSAQVRLRLRHLTDGHTIERVFQAGSKFVRARLENRDAQYLYREGDLFYFMDSESFEQTSLDAGQLGDAVQYLKEGLVVTVLLHEGAPISAELPNTVDLRITDTAPGFRGDTAAGSSKPATLETGLVVNVPYFLNPGDLVKVDTRSGDYVERVSSG
ncbi:MAG TPA: elongation factor P [Dehalococcoidia bacterium]|nr:elongation factor P [Dehalococcoidia bacterium]